MMRVCFFLLLLVTLSVAFPATAQNPEDVRIVVQEQLRAVLGRDFVLLSYSYEGMTWPDAALGCPQAGQIAAPGQVPGYRWSFLVDDGINYAVHSDASGSQVVVCAETSTPEITYSTYNGQFFNLEHPNLWSAQRRSDVQVDFIFRGQAGCNLPGMSVEAYPSYQAALDQLGMAELGRLSLGEIGLNQLNGATITYPLACENVAQNWRASALEASNGAGFIVRQWSLAQTFPIWDKVFRVILLSLTPTDALPVAAAAGPTNPTPLPESALLPAPPPAPVVDMTTVPLVHVFVQDVYVGQINNLPGEFVTTDVSHPRERLRYASATGQLAYVENETDLFTVNITTMGFAQLVTTEMGALPPAWSPDGTQLAYAVPQDDSNVLLKVRQADGTDRDLGTIPFTGSCTLDSGYLVDQLYDQETGSGLTFVWLTGDRFLYTPQCDGNGLAIWNSTDGSLTDLGDDLRRAQLTADQTRLAAISAGGLTLIDLATLATSPLPTTYPPDQLGWDVTGTQIYYSTLIPQENAIYADAAFQQKTEEFLGQFPFESRQNTVRVFQLDTNNRAEVQRWENTGFAVGQIKGMPDGSGFLVSWIPSDRAMLTNFQQNQLLTVIRSSRPEPQLYFIPADGGAGQLLAVSGQPLFAR